MMPPRPTTPPQASAGAVGVFTALLEARTGQRIAANRAWRVDAALRPLLQERGAATVDELVRQVLAGEDVMLADRIVDALLNQETSFFRDAGVIEGASEAIASMSDAPRIWCAGCASGQEPLSLAMTFAERDGPMPEVIATDVSLAAVNRARAGRFSQFEIQRGLPVRRMLRWFSQEGDDWIASAELVRAISWRRHNLVADPAPSGRFDAVFCRNVLFYLAPALRSRVLDTIANVLRPDGLLVLGAGETVIGQSDRFVPSRRFRGLYEVAPPAEPAKQVYMAR